MREDSSLSLSILGSPLVAVATDVGAWRIVLPVLRELDRRGVAYRVMLAEPSASIARQDGVPFIPLTGATPAERATAVLTARPGALLLGTSVQAVVERELARRARLMEPPVPTVGVLDAMLFAARRFGEGLAELPDLLACPDEETRRRLLAAGAPDDRLITTGNPTLEEIGRGALTPQLPPLRGANILRLASSLGTYADVTVCGRGGDDRLLPSPTDVLFVSSPVAAMRLRGAYFALDEREALDDVLAALADLREYAPGGFRVRVRLHPVQRAEGLPPPPPGIMLEPDDDPDRIASCMKADVVVGLSSTLLGEARMLPRAAIAYLPGPFWEQEPVFAPAYGVELAPTRRDLRLMLRRALAEPPAPAPLADHLGAAGRIADLLRAVVSEAVD